MNPFSASLSRKLLQRATFAIGTIILVAAYLPLGGGCPADEPTDLSNPLELQDDGLLVDDANPSDGEISGELTALDYETATIQNQPVSISVTARSVSDLIQAFSVVTEPAQGSISSVSSVGENAIEVTYSPPTDYVGRAQFSYDISVGDVRSNTATIGINVYPEVRFNVEILAEQPQPVVLVQAFTKTGEELPEGTYTWQFDDQQESGPVSTHAVREYVFAHGGSHVITLTLTLAGLTAPIGCSTGDTGGDKDFEFTTSSQAGVLKVAPSDGLNSSGNQGGPFDPDSKTYTLSNTGGEPINWSASRTQNWINLSQTNGTLAPGGSTAVIVSISDNANSLPARPEQPYTDTITFANITNGNGNAVRAVSLTVNSVPDDPDPGFLEVTPTGGLISAGPQGGPFTPSSKTYTLTNTGDEPLDWAASKTQNWVSLSNIGGTLEPDASDMVIVSINSNANDLGVGSYSDTVAFINATTGDGDTGRGVSLHVNPPDMLVVSGHVADNEGTGIGDVTINGLPGDPVTNGSGDYSVTVESGFSGTATPSKAGYDFSPISRTYSNITANQSNQDYTGTLQTFVISGRVTDGGGTGIGDVVIRGLPDEPVTDPNGYYSATVDCGFTGDAWPEELFEEPDYVFDPPYRWYPPVDDDQPDQDYTGREAGTALPMTTASRTTGVAPLAVFFDAVDTADPPWSSSVVQPPDGDYASFHYEWNFGDNPSATWSTNGKSKNEATGYVSAHVFEDPGTYTVMLTVMDTDGQTHDYEQGIEVLSFSGTTYYVSNSGGLDNYDGLSPAWPFHSFAKAMSMIAPNTRILFKRGDSWTISSGASITSNGPGVLGAYYNADGTDDPAQPKPLIHITATATIFSLPGSNHDDWRFMDFELSGPGANPSAGTAFGAGYSGDLRHLLLLRLDIHDFWVGVMCTFGTTGHDGNTIADCVQRDNTLHSAFIGGQRLAIIGNDVQNMGNHVLRMWHSRKSVVSGNILHGAAHGHALKLHNQCSVDTEYVVVSDNDFQSGDYPWTVCIGPQDSIHDERVSNLIFERNVIRANSGEQVALLVWARDVTVRNNVFIGTGSAPWYRAVVIERRGIEPPPENVSVVNNTVYKAGSGSEFYICQVGNGAENVTVRNNLASAPDVTTKAVMSGSCPGLVVDHNLLTDTPGFVNAADGNFQLEWDSTAVDQGVQLILTREDYVWRHRPQGDSHDIGAFEGW